MKQKKSGISYKWREYLTGYAFVSIWIIGFLVFTLQPLCYSLFLSFQRVLITADGIETTYVGLDNIKNAFVSDVVFMDGLTEFLKEMVLTVPAVIVFSLIIALLLNLKIKFKGFFRTVFFLPVIIMTGPVINELINQNSFTLSGLNNYGFIWFIGFNFNQSISSLLISLLSNMILVLWYTGVQSLIFLAALQKINRQVYEASRIDGASPWESFWKITLPTLEPMILVNLIYTIITLSAFELNQVSTHISTQMFNIRTGFGYASALSWIYFIALSLVLGLVLFAMTYRPKRKYGG